MTTTRTAQEAGQFAGDAPLTGHHIQGHSINVILAKGVPEEVLRSSVTHFGTRGLFGKPIRRTSQHDRDNVRRKRWRVAQSSKPKIKPRLNHQLEDDGGRDHQEGSQQSRSVPPSVPNAIGSMNTADKRTLPPSLPSLPPSNVKSTSSSPYSTHAYISAGGASTHPAYSQPEASLGLASDGARSTSVNCHSHALPLPITSAGQVRRILGVSGSHVFPAAAVKQRYMNTTSITLETPHGSSNVAVDMPDPLPHPPPYHQQSAITNSPTRRMHQGRYSRHLFAPTTATFRALRSRQWCGPARMFSESTTGAERTCGPVCATHGTFYQHAPAPYPSPSHRSAAGHAHSSCSPVNAKSSTVRQFAGFGIMQPAAAIGAHQARIRQHSETPFRSHTSDDYAPHVSTTTSPPHTHAINANCTPRTYMTSVPPVDSVNQHRIDAPPTTNAQRRSQSVRTSASTYSELAHALVDHHPVALPAMQAAVSGVIVDPAAVCAPKVQSGPISSPVTSVPGSQAWHAHWQNDLPIAPQPNPNYLPTWPVLDAALAPGISISRAHATADMAGNFDCRPFSPDIMAPLFCRDFARGRGHEETHLKESSAGPQRDLQQQLHTTSTWQEAQYNLYYPYPYPAPEPNSRQASSMDGSSER